MAITFVNKAQTSNGAAATTIVVTITPGTGNLITGVFSWGSSNITGLTPGSTTTVIQTSTGQNVLCIDAITEAGGPVATVTYSAIVTGSPTSITCTIPGGSTGQRYGTVQVWSGVSTATPDGHNLVSIQTASTIQTSGSITTTAAGDLLVGYLAGNWSGTTTITGASFSATGTGSTIRNNDATNLLGADSSEIQTASGASTASFNLSVAQNYAAGIAAFKAAAAGIPLTQNPDWGLNPFRYSRYPYPWAQWAEAGNVQLPFRDLTKPSTHQGNFDNPPRVTWYRSWEQGPTRSTVQNPFVQSNWPNPKPVTWYQSWTNSFRLTNPFNQTDWPNPRTYKPIDQFWSQSLVNFYQSETFPFVQRDWPLPKTSQPLLQTWSQSLNTFYQSETFPFVQYDWPNPQRIIWYRSIEDSGDALTATVVGSPFFQSDWPLPRTYQPIDQFWQNNLQLLPQPTPPLPFFQNVDSPLPVVSQPINQTWVQSLVNFYQANTFPFSQSDWKNPYPTYWYRDHNQNLVILLPVGAKPFNQSDWPLTKAPPPLDQFFSQALVLNLPEPPPPEIIASAGRWISPEEVISSIARKYGRIGGLASADSRTAAERSILASIAAAHRWKK